MKKQRRSFAERLAAVAHNRFSCWTWGGEIGKNGYGYAWWQGRKQLAHRLSYSLLRGPIPDGMHLDHLCRNRACFNPWDVEPVELAENNARSWDVARKECCPKGHPYTPENTGYRGDGRYCRQNREISRAYHRRKIGRETRRSAPNRIDILPIAG